MNINDYQTWTDLPARYPEAGSNSNWELNYLFLGFVGEAGETVDEWKKFLREDKGTYETEVGDCGGNFLTLSLAHRKKILTELSDSLYYMTRIAKILGVTIEELADINIAKIQGRMDRGTLHGSGDDR